MIISCRSHTKKHPPGIEDREKELHSTILGLLRLLVFAALLGTLRPAESAAQQRFIQGGIAAIPGIGAQVGYVGARSFYTVEGILYVDATPGFAGGEGNVQVAAGLGGAIRPLGVLRTIGDTDQNYDFDIGMRFGPSLFFATNATRSDKNQQFRLILEPFFRFSTRLGNGQLVYVEAGTVRPLLRAGVWFSL